MKQKSVQHNYVIGGVLHLVLHGRESVSVRSIVVPRCRITTYSSFQQGKGQFTPLSFSALQLVVHACVYRSSRGFEHARFVIMLSDRIDG